MHYTTILNFCHCFWSFPGCDFNPTTPHQCLHIEEYHGPPCFKNGTHATQFNNAVGVTSDWFKSTIRESGSATADLHAEPSEPQVFTTWATTESSRKDKPSLPEIGLPRYLKKEDLFTGCCLSSSLISRETLRDTFLYKLPSRTEKLHDLGVKSTASVLSNAICS